MQHGLQQWVRNCLLPEPVDSPEADAAGIIFCEWLLMERAYLKAQMKDPNAKREIVLDEK